MARDNDADDKGPGGIAGDVREVVDLVRDYAKQETIGPLKNAGKYLAFGVSGAISLALGLLLLVLAGLRALQTETGTRLTGNWSWAPYWIMAFAGIVLIALAIRAITRGGDEL